MSSLPESTSEPIACSEMTAPRLWKPVLFLLLAGVAICWTFATPLFGISDESAQVMKAAAVVRGEFVGTAAGGPNTLVQIPEDLIGSDRLPCFMFKTDVSAGCAAPLGHDSRNVSELTWTGYYPPLYYLLVGWPSLLFQGSIAIHAMRLISALLGAAFLAGAFFSAAEARGRPLLVPAVAALATPYVFVYVGAVNPSGLEMTSALCAWTSGVALANGPPEASRRRIVVRLVVALAVLAQVRYLGPVFVAAIVITLVSWYGLGPVRALLRRRSVRLMVGGVGLCSAFTVFWDLVISNLSLLPSGRNLAPHSGLFSVLLQSGERFGADLWQIVGNFGWANGYPPVWVTALGLAVMALLLIVGLRNAARRQRMVVFGLMVFSVLFAVAAVAVEANKDGLLGQGRYWLPLLTGILVAAAEAGGSRLRRANRPLWTAVALSACVVAIACFQVALDRFRFGTGQPEVRAGWNPPGGAAVWSILYTAASVVVAWWWWRRSRGSPKEPVAAAVSVATSRTSRSAEVLRT